MMAAGIRLDGRWAHSMPDSMEVEAQGDHESLVRLEGDGETVGSWFRISPESLAEVADDADEESVVRRTAQFLARRQGVPDFPRVVELEDVIASYDDYLPTMTGRQRPPSDS